MGIYNNVDASKIEIQRGNAKYIQAGIHENVSILGARYEKTEKGSEFLAIDIVDSKNNKLSHTEWPIKTNIPFDQLDDIKKQNTIKVLEGQVKKLTQIVEAVLGLPLDSFVLKASSFEEMAKRVCEAINGKTEGKLFRVKIVYDKKGFTSMANNPKYTFIEPMSIATEDSNIRILTSDQVERPIMKDKETKVENVLEYTSTPAVDKSPF